jgi:hypothetical protein
MEAITNNLFFDKRGISAQGRRLWVPKKGDSTRGYMSGSFIICVYITLPVSEFVAFIHYFSAV